MIPANANPLLLTGDTGYRIERSLRLRRSVTGVVGRILGIATSRTKFTLSVWTKQGVASAIDTLFAAGIDTANVGYVYFRTDAGGVIQIGDLNSNTTTFSVQTVAQFRDFAAHMHIVIAYDSTQATASDRIKLTVNGNPMTLTGTYPTLNAICYLNSTTQHYFGGTPAYGRYYDGLISDAYFIDGQALPAAAFGEFDINDTWNPKKYTGTYGSNGVHLEFKDSSAATAAAIGKDTSGNGNNWTPTNISVTAGATNDSLIDTPTNFDDGGSGRGNYCVMNPLDKGMNITLSNGNLTMSPVTAAWGSCRGTQWIDSGKWYFESEVTAAIMTAAIGIANSIESLSNFAGNTINGWTIYGETGDLRHGVNSSLLGPLAANDRISVAVDMDNRKVWFAKNGIWGASGNPAIGLNPAAADLNAPVVPVVSLHSAASGSVHFNFGQRPFSYTPPTGFKALNAQNLPLPVIPRSRRAFDIVRRTGTAAIGAVTGLLMRPGMVWSKGMPAAVSNVLINSVLGAGKGLSSNLSDALRDVPSTITSFNSDGYSFGYSASDYYDFNTTGRAFIDWVWALGPQYGFSITPYRGDGAAGRLIAHNLNATPAAFFCKRTSGTGEWMGQHQSLPANNTIYLNSMYNGGTYLDRFNRAGLSSTNIQIGANAAEANENGTDYILMAWAEIPGFSKFGSFAANGLVDGPFVNCGFEVAFLLLKSQTSAGTNWVIKDNRRQGANPATGNLYANANLAEDQTASVNVDLLSNGFKIRGTYPSINASGDTILYYAFAASPFKTARGK